MGLGTEQAGFEKAKMLVEQISSGDLTGGAAV